MKKHQEKHFFKSLLSIFLPWVIMLMYGNIGGAIVCLILQTTIIGWIPAAIWARRTINGTLNKPGTSENPAP